MDSPEEKSLWPNPYERFPAVLARVVIALRASAAGQANGAFVEALENLARTREALSDELHQIWTIFQTVPTGLVILDGEGTVVGMNQAARQFVPGPPGKVLGRRWTELFWPVRRDGSPLPLGELPSMEALREGKPVLDATLGVMHPDGKVHWLIGNAIPLAGRDSATASRVLVAFTDITRRVELQEALEKERQRLRAILDNAPVGILVVDRSENIVLANREIRARSAVSIFQAGQPCRDCLRGITYRRPDGRAYAIEDVPVLRALKSGEPVQAEEMRIEFPGGGSMLILASALPIRDADGHVVEAIAISIDITRLEEVEKQRAEFLGVISHEMRTPLAAMKGTAVMALDHRATLGQTDIKELFTIIDKETDRLVDLVNNLLDMTRIESGSLSVKRQPGYVRDVVAEAVEGFRSSRYTNPVNVQIPGDHIPAEIDARRVRQVVMNLLTNAAHFSSPGSPIGVTVTRQGEGIAVAIQDRGRGIPREKLPLLFKKFSRLDTGRRDSPSGTGLGLVICKGIVEAHGGTISAESPGEGQGTTVTFTLPVSTRLAVAGVHGSETPLGEAGNRVTGQKLVLAVDDEPGILELLRTVLREGGYDAATVGDPSRVVDLIRAQRPDLVLLDLGFPGADGFDILNRIRDLSHVPVIILTGRTSKQDIVRAFKLGVDDYITKPFGQSELLARIGAVLRKSANRHEGVRT